MDKKSAFTILEILAISVLLFISINLVVMFLNKTSTRDKVVNIIKYVYDTGVISLTRQNEKIADWGWRGDDYNTSFRIANQYFLPAFGEFSSCDNVLDCVGGYSSLNSDEYTNFRQEKDYARFILKKNNIHVAILSKGNCKNANDELCAMVVVDINNKDLPNQLGVDVFYFGIYANGMFMPYGYNFPREKIEQNCSKYSYGETCAAKIMLDGWKMKTTSPNIYPTYNRS